MSHINDIDHIGVTLDGDDLVMAITAKGGRTLVRLDDRLLGLLLADMARIERQLVEENTAALSQRPRRERAGS